MQKSFLPKRRLGTSINSKFLSSYTNYRQKLTLHAASKPKLNPLFSFCLFVFVLIYPTFPNFDPILFTRPFYSFSRQRQIKLKTVFTYQQNIFKQLRAIGHISIGSKTSVQQLLVVAVTRDETIFLSYGWLTSRSLTLCGSSSLTLYTSSQRTFNEEPFSNLTFKKVPNFKKELKLLYYGRRERSTLPWLSISL